MKKLILLFSFVYFSNVYKLIAQDYNDMSKKELRVEHFNKLKVIDSLNKELSNKDNIIGLLKIKVDSLNKQIVSLDSNFSKVQIDLQKAIEKSNKISKINDSIKNRIKELEFKLSNSNKKISDLQNEIINFNKESDESIFDKNNKEICSLLEWEIKYIGDIIQNKNMYDSDEDYFNTITGKKELLRLQKEGELIESESDNFFEARDGRTKADVKSNFELIKSCPNYHVFIKYRDKIIELRPFIENVMKLKM